MRITANSLCCNGSDNVAPRRIELRTHGFSVRRIPLSHKGVADIERETVTYIDVKQPRQEGTRNPPGRLLR
jgi:hypothetical protein